MKAKDIFNLAVRLLGLFFIYLAAREVPVIFAQPPDNVMVHTLLTIGLFIGLGWWMLGGAPLLVKRAYPETSQQPSREVASQTVKSDA